MVHTGPQITEEANDRDSVRAAQSGRIGHYQPVTATTARVLEYLNRRLPLWPGPGLEPQTLEHPAHDPGVCHGVLGVCERARRQPLLSREQLIALHGPTVRRGRYSDNARLLCAGTLIWLDWCLLWPAGRQVVPGAGPGAGSRTGCRWRAYLVTFAARPAPGVTATPSEPWDGAVTVAGDKGVILPVSGLIANCDRAPSPSLVT